MCVPRMHSFPEARLSLNMHVNLFDKMARQIFSEARKSELSRTTRGALITYDGQWPEIRYSYEASPFAFWVTRRSGPIFLHSSGVIVLSADTRVSVFEDRYSEVQGDNDRMTFA
jgi:hypothetical protein